MSYKQFNTEVIRIEILSVDLGSHTEKNNCLPNKWAMFDQFLLCNFVVVYEDFVFTANDDEYAIRSSGIRDF